MFTRYTIIDPIIRALGWDTADPHQIRFEYPWPKDGGVDYALFNRNRQPVILIEAKGWYKDSGAHEWQLEGYIEKTRNNGERPSVGVLTDGWNWHLYDLKKRGAFENKFTETVDIYDGGIWSSARTLNRELRKQRWW